MKTVTVKFDGLETMDAHCIVSVTSSTAVKQSTSEFFFQQPSSPNTEEFRQQPSSQNTDAEQLSQQLRSPNTEQLSQLNLPSKSSLLNYPSLKSLWNQTRGKLKVYVKYLLIGVAFCLFMFFGSIAYQFCLNNQFMIHRSVDHPRKVSIVKYSFFRDIYQKDTIIYKYWQSENTNDNGAGRRDVRKDSANSHTVGPHQCKNEKYIEKENGHDFATKQKTARKEKTVKRQNGKKAESREFMKRRQRLDGIQQTFYTLHVYLQWIAGYLRSLCNCVFVIYVVYAWGSEDGLDITDILCWIALQRASWVDYD